MVTSPTPINSSSATRSWLSICSVSRRARPLITAGRVVGFHGRWLFAEQIIVEHLAGDWPGGARAEAGVFNKHCKREFGVVGRRVGDEQRMVAMALLHAALDILLALFDRYHLGSAGLSRTHIRRA